MRRAGLLLAGLVLWARSPAAETMDRTVKANTRSAIGGFLGYEVDTCYPSAIPAVESPAGAEQRQHRGDPA